MIRVDHLGTASTQAGGFFAETTIPVVAGTAESVTLWGTGQGAGTKQCFGSLIVEGLF